MKKENNMPFAEWLLWKKLETGNPQGYEFYYNYEIGGVTVNFYCPKAKLAVEVKEKNFKKGIEERMKKQYLQSLGITILQFTPNDIYKNRYKILESILHKIEKKYAQSLQVSRQSALIHEGA